MLTRAGLANPERRVWPGQSPPRHVGAEAISVVQQRPVSRWQKVYHDSQKRETSAFVALRVTSTVWQVRRNQGRPPRFSGFAEVVDERDRETLCLVLNLQNVDHGILFLGLKL